MSASDTLFRTQSELAQQLTNGGYTGELRTRLESLLEEMDAVRLLPGMDTSPSGLPPAKRNAQQIIAAFTANNPGTNALAVGEPQKPVVLLP